MNLPLIDIVIPTYNRAKMLGESLQTLICLETAGRFRYAITVVDNASTDATRETVEQVAREAEIPVHYLYHAEPGDAPPRNRAIAETSGEWLAFYDDDQLAEPDCLLKLYDEAQRSGALIVGGAVHLHLPARALAGLGPFVRRNSLREINFGSSVRRFSGKRLPGGANVLVARRVFESLGDFDPKMVWGGSDRDFFFRACAAGFEIRYASTSVIRHCIPVQRTTPEYLRWDAQQGSSAMACHDFKYRGRAMLLASCLARIGHASLVLAPGLAWASATRRAPLRLDYEIRLWRATGYVRRTLALLAPQWFSQKRYFEELEFRRGRQVGQKASNESGPSAFACPSGSVASRELGSRHGSLVQHSKAGAGSTTGFRPSGASDSGEVAMVTPLISVIVPTYNRYDMLRGALESLIRQETEGELSYELIVVDNASTDQTRSLVEELAAQSPIPVRYFYEATPGPGAARNCGLAQAQGEWVAFFDDDEVATPDWLRQLYKAAIKTGALIVGGAMHLDLPQETLDRLGRYVRQTSLREIDYYSTIRPYSDKRLPGTNNALVAAQVFRKVGKFDPSKVCGEEDSDFFLRARAVGISPYYTPHAVVRHRIPPSRITEEYLRWDARQGSSAFAGLDCRFKGRGKLALICLARIVHASFIVVPRLAWGRLRGDSGEVLGQRYRLWRTEGYIRATLAKLAPRWFPQRKYFADLEFRRGRDIGHQAVEVELVS